MSPGLLRRLMNLWPPFIGAGIRVVRIAPDYGEVDVTMRLAWYNRNYIGTHFGGSLYAMTDPFYMLMTLHRLGPGYTVLDQSGAIDYVAPGRGRVHARFRLADDRVEEIRQRAAGGGRVLPEFSVDVVDDDGNVVARVRKTLYVRRRKDASGAAA